MKSRVLSILLGFCIVLHLIAMLIPVPDLASFVSSLEDLGWFVILVIVCMWLETPIRTTLTKMIAWRMYITKFASTAQLKLVCNDVQCLGLALHGLTPEAENARRKYFQMRGEPLPALLVPPQHAILYAEFESLVKMLTHFGFPDLSRVRLAEKDLAFIQQWISSLQMRLSQHQQETLAQKQALDAALVNLAQQHQKIGNIIICQDPGYQRIEGTLRFLEIMAKDQHVSLEVMLTYAQKLQSDLTTLTNRYQTVVRS